MMRITKAKFNKLLTRNKCVFQVTVENADLYDIFYVYYELENGRQLLADHSNGFLNKFTIKFYEICKPLDDKYIIQYWGEHLVNIIMSEKFNHKFKEMFND